MDWNGRLPTSLSNAASTARSGACSERISSQLAAFTLKYSAALACRRRFTAASRSRSRSICGSACVDAADDAVHEVARRVVVGDAEESPGPLLIAADQAGVEQELQMARDARLRLVEDVGKVGDGEVTAREQRKNAQAAGFRRRLQSIDQTIKGCRHVAVSTIHI